MSSIANQIKQNLEDIKLNVALAKAKLGISDTSVESQTAQQQYGAYMPDYRHHVRVPFTFFRESDAGDKSKWLYFWVNPSECAWSISTRTSIEKVSGGAIHHEWPSTGVGEQNSSRFDQPIIRFSFQSGVITPYAYQDIDKGDAKDLIPPGLGNFYDFISLLNRPNVTAMGTPNYVNIFYISSTFPLLELKGHFTPEGVSWTDTANDPYTISNWGASFEVFVSDLSSSKLRETFALLSVWGDNSSGRDLGNALENFNNSFDPNAYADQLAAEVAASEET